MTRYGMVIDLSKCIACYGCFAACKDEHWDNDYPPYTAGQPRFGQFWINPVKKERGEYPFVRVAYMPMLCQQCGDAPCMDAAKDGAVFRKKNGVVVFDPVKSVGQRQIMEACPYGVVYWNEEKNIPQKCTLCAHRIDEGKTPRCVQFCPSGCLTFGDFDDPKSDVAKLLASGKAEVFHPEWENKPTIYYSNLKKGTSSLVGGAVALHDVNECAEGAVVVLTGEGKRRQTKTDAFGNFEFDGLQPGNYSVRVKARGYKPQAAKFELETSKYLGTFDLAKS
ncbi:MAG TPA: 4Fe-4S dicluster domain-containing protein [Nitrososphaerales archaeon]|nr:4Fe-4S dicluster domain-containing protein [Nitrososphaerales archaeon]